MAEGFSRWTTYITCALCSARTPPRNGEAAAQCDADARAMGWLALPERTNAQGMKRFEGWICAECLRDIKAALAVGKTLSLPGVG